jgi:HSP20 family protein
LHTLSTLCSIDFELRHTFSPHASTIALVSSPPILPAHTSHELKCNSSDPISGVTRVSFDSQEIWHPIYLAIYQEFSMTVVRYEPWALVSRLQKEVDRLFGAPLTTAADSGAWLPPVDIHEEANQFVLHVDLPGVDPKAVEITSDQGVLTIRGQREDTRKESREGFRRIERISGEFQRRFSLPESADAQNIKAKVANGVLEVAIPKLAQVQPHKIQVEAA